MIRQARSEDLAALRELEQAADQAFRNVGMGAIAEGEPTPLAALAGYERDGRAWVFVDDLDRPEAFLLIDLLDGAAHIEQISVTPHAARLGLGAALIQRAADWARSQKCDALTLMTFRDVPWNRPYYERLGFQVLDREHLTAGLVGLQVQEADLGLTRWPRVAMRREIQR